MHHIAGRYCESSSRGISEGIESLPLQACSERESENSVVNSSIELKCFGVIWIMRVERSLKAKGCDEVKARSR